MKKEKEKEQKKKKLEEKNEVEEEEENKKEVKEEEEVEEEEQEKYEVDDDDGIKTVNAHIFPIHFQPDATGDRITRSKSFDSFKLTLKANDLEDFFRNSCFGQYLDLLEENNARFQMTMVYELLKRREFAIVTGLKCHSPSEKILEFTIKKQSQRRKKREAQTSKEQSTEAWAFEVIPHLRHQVTTTEEEISSPRILRWLRAKNVYHAPDIFNRPHDVVMYPWLVPTE
ncbi:hypothetical protein KY289_007839 [Solanum tuberosum]|nr:hypothetical protein KY289_007839 [Solanum tuberosum]